MRIFIVIVFISLSVFVNAQGNLQFNQVKLVTTSETVPAGKVWKLENYLPSSQLAIDLNRQPNQASAGGTKNFIVLVNGAQVFLQTTITREVGRNDGYWSQDGYATAADYRIFDAPIWLPAGTTLAASTNVMSLSVVEFNVLP
ncbi:MAG: hypothetical protein K9I25_04075 [Crocinitomicaceae bacterium]|jgi:hypothetical protein|nr:hypothetical protein [Crocinitomicaceae bacterium]